MFRAAALALCVVAGAACRAPGGAQQTSRASDEWVRSYPFAAGGELQLINTNGAIEIESVPPSASGGPGDAGRPGQIDVRAERVAHATTDAAARDFLTRIAIREESLPGKVTVQTERIRGMLIGVSFEVTYHVKVPTTAAVRAQTANGPVTVTGRTSRLSLSTVNGAITGNSVAGAIQARTVNQNVTLDVSEVGTEPIDVRTTNGAIQLSVPVNTDANLSATVVNGRIDVAGLAFQAFDSQNRRRVRGRINAGGTPIELATVNGDIQVHERR